jgi:ABC-type transport system involved in multi-copper enzyme maturation permease subunit
VTTWMPPAEQMSASGVAAPRASSDWLAVTLRLVRWELFQTWRRVMAKVLLGILLGFFVLEVAGYVLVYVASSGSGQAGDNPLSPVIRNQVTFPASVSLSAGYAGSVGVVLLCIIAGSLVGGEYGFGTLRLALSRGIMRGQALAAKVAALAVVSAAVVGAMVVLGVLVGVTIGPALGGTVHGMGLDGLVQLVAYWAAVSLRLFIYSLIAVLLATLGRSTAAGIGGALGFILVEAIGLPILTAVITGERAFAYSQHVPVPPFVDVLTVVRVAFIQTNADALASAAQQGPLNLAILPSSSPASSLLQNFLPAAPSTLQALLVLLLWGAALVGLAYLLVRGRDVTE